MKIKKATVLLAVFLLVGCGRADQAKEETQTVGASKEQEEETVTPMTLHVFAAASMTETLEKIQEMYKEEEPGVSLAFSFDSSGTLKTQIQEGADCDVFISAAQKQMDQLDIEADASVNEEGLDFVVEDSRVNLLENKVVLVVPEGNPAGIESFEDLGADKLKLLALGNEDVPVGQYSVEILNTLGILDELEADNKITYGSNVKEVTTQVAEATVDAGIIYATDAFAAGLDTVAEAGSDLCKPAIYPAAVMKGAQYPAEAQAFLDYLQTDACMEVFEEVGFKRVR
ncbi:MAG: molybdate ABC transporter substrate-binding protein [Lachnospiraceae bacterium]|nr:molybdate ABC transporter substrate-binding protein [Lachnospiraceae bacterium]